jgi:hypothetical protein
MLSCDSDLVKLRGEIIAHRAPEGGTGERDTDVRLRWHCCGEATPNAPRAFTVESRVKTGLGDRQRR